MPNVYEFGFLSQITAISFPSAKFLTVECATQNNNNGQILWAEWNAPPIVPQPAGLFLDNNLQDVLYPDRSSYLNVAIPGKGVAHPGLDVSGKVSSGNAAWAYPLPSIRVVTEAGAEDDVKGIGFFNLKLLTPLNDKFQLTLLVQGASDVPPTWSVRAALWKPGTSFKNKVVKGAITDLSGMLTSHKLSGTVDEFHTNLINISADTRHKQNIITLTKAFV